MAQYLPDVRTDDLEADDEIVAVRLHHNVEVIRADEYRSNVVVESTWTHEALSLPIDATVTVLREL